MIRTPKLTTTADTDVLTTQLIAWRDSGIVSGWSCCSLLSDQCRGGGRGPHMGPQALNAGCGVTTETTNCWPNYHFTCITGTSNTRPGSELPCDAAPGDTAAGDWRQSTELRPAAGWRLCGGPAAPPAAWLLLASWPGLAAVQLYRRPGQVRQRRNVARQRRHRAGERTGLSWKWY